MHPHDYYAPYSDEPHLHNRGEGRHYVEPDWQANAAGHQLPVLSTVGRGPRGEGLQIGNVVEQDGIESFALYSTLTGELLWQSPNLAPGDLSFDALPFDQLSAGQAAPLDIKWTRGGTTKTTHAYLPCGERGSFIYLLKEALQRNTTDVYQTTMGQLVMYKRDTWPNHKKPNAKVNDIVMCRITDADGFYLAIGDIVAVGSRNNEEITESTPVQFVVRTEIPGIDPNLKSNDTIVFNLDPDKALDWTPTNHARPRWVFEDVTWQDIVNLYNRGGKAVAIYNNLLGQFEQGYGFELQTMPIQFLRIDRYTTPDQGLFSVWGCLENEGFFTCECEVKASTYEEAYSTFMNTPLEFIADS